MSKFQEKKDEIKQQAMQSLNKKGEPKKTFSKSQFNELTAAYLNSPEYVETQVKIKDGAPSIMETNPVEDLRSDVIGGIAKAAGLDKAEQEKLVNEYQFSSKTDYHSMFSNVLEAYTGECTRKFKFTARPDLDASFTLETIPEATKEVKAPGSDTSKQVRFGAYRKLKAKSTCPKNLREDA